MTPLELASQYWGEEEAEELGKRLGWSAGNVLQIAIALGYQADDAS